MRYWIGFMSAYLCLCLLAACAGTPAETVEEPTEKPTETQTIPEDPVPGYAVSTCRVVSGAGTEMLLLADRDGGEIYQMPCGGRDDLAALRDGDLVEVCFDGCILESWPEQFGGVKSVSVVNGGFDNLCQLYLHVLEDLWNVDAGLNEGIAQLGVDLSETSLSVSERAAVAWTFAAKHDAFPVQGTYQELLEQGYITEHPVEGEEFKYPAWDDGCLFSIREKPMEGTYSLKPVTFDAEKWRSGTGAYFFCNCTSVQSALGEWGEYAVGSEAIA